MIEIKRITPQETYTIRKDVLRGNIPLPFEFNGDFEESTFHLGVFKEDKLIAISSYMKANNVHFKGEQYQLRGMATLNEYQGFGAGKLMMQEAFSILTRLKVDYLWCNARIIAVKFYEKHGLKTMGASFDIPLIGEHFVMFKQID